jgi:hypothetical protein
VLLPDSAVLKEIWYCVGFSLFFFSPLCAPRELFGFLLSSPLKKSSCLHFCAFHDFTPSSPAFVTSVFLRWVTLVRTFLFFILSQKFLRPRVYTMTCVLPSHLPPSLRALVFRGLSQEAPFTPSTICSTSDCISIVPLPSVPSRQSYSVLFFGGYLLSFADIFTLRFTLGSAHFTSLSLHFHELVALFFSWGHFLPPSPHYSSLALLMC